MPSEVVRTRATAGMKGTSMKGFEPAPQSTENPKDYKKIMTKT